MVVHRSEVREMAHKGSFVALSGAFPGKVVEMICDYALSDYLERSAKAICPFCNKEDMVWPGFVSCRGCKKEFIAVR